MVAPRSPTTTSTASTTSGGGAWLATVGPSTSYTDTTAVNGTTYYYRVSAVNRLGEGPRSAERSATPATVPGAPTLVSATGGIGSATLSWNAPGSNGGSSVSGYTATASPGGATCSVTGLGCTIGGLSNGTSYSFTRTCDERDRDRCAIERALCHPGQPPSAPRNLTAVTNKPRGVKLTWSAPAANGRSAVTGYRISRATSSGAEVFLVSVGSTATSYEDLGTTKGIRYYYWVTAVNAFGVGPASNEASAVAKWPSRTRDAAVRRRLRRPADARMAGLTAVAPRSRSAVTSTARGGSD